MIVGIDPGKTVGIACIDMGGKIMYSTHKPFAGEEWVIQQLNSVGTPVIIASDKPTRSKFIDKINAAFNSRLFYPQRILRVQEKREAIKSTYIKDVHERDAYVAALKAYNTYKNKFMQIDSSMRGAKSEEIKVKVIKKYSVSEALTNRKSGRK
jgi:predicted RNase H-like nuclease (RuvC/YqgF family)